MLPQLLSVFGYLYSHYSLIQLSAFLLNLRSIFPQVRNIFPYSVDGYKGYSGVNLFGLENPALINILLLSAFFLSHSIPARQSVKQAVKLGRLYRPLYVIQSAFFIHTLIKYWRPLPTGSRTIVWDTSLHPSIGWGIFALGFIWMYTSTLATDYFDLFGLKDGFGKDLSKIYGLGDFTNTFPVTRHFSVVRHPMMLGILVMLFATPVMTLNHLIFSIAVSMYINFAVRNLKEPDLVRRYGEPYIGYMKRVPGFCPFFSGASIDELRNARATQTKEVGKREVK